MGHINNTVAQYQAVDALSDMDIDSEEPINEDESVEKDDEMAAESENDSDDLHQQTLEIPIGAIVT